MKSKILLAVLAIIMAVPLKAQVEYYGMTNIGGTSNAGTIFKTNSSGTNLQTIYNFEYENKGKNPQGILSQATNGKLYGVARFGGDNISSFPYYSSLKHSGVIYEFDPSTNIYNVLYHFDDTASGCWPEDSPIEAANGKLYGVVRGGGVHNYGTVYCFDRATSTYTKIHDFEGSYAAVGYDGVQPVGNLLKATDGKLYGLTNGGGYNGHGTIFKIDPTTNTYTKLLDLQISYSGTNAGYSPESGLIQAANGKMYATTQSGGSSYNGNIFEYNPITNIATNKFEFTGNGMGVYPYGSLSVIGVDSLYGVTYNYYNSISHYYLWRYQISTGNLVVVDSIVNGTFSRELSITPSGKLLVSGYDYNISYGIRFWEFDPATRTRVLKDTTNLATNSQGMMLASNGKFYGGFGNQFGTPYSDGTFLEYDMTNHQVIRKFNFSDPIDGVSPESGLMMATNGRLYGTTSLGGDYNKGVIFEINPSNDAYTVKFSLDSLSGYAPRSIITETSNGKFYILTRRGGTTGLGTIIQIDTTTWTLSKKADFTTSIGRNPEGKLTEANNGLLYGLAPYEGGNGYGSIFEFNPNTNALNIKYSFNYSNATGYSPIGSLLLADNGNLYGYTRYGGGSSYANGALFEYVPGTTTCTSKKLMLQYSGYYAERNTPIQLDNGKMYSLIKGGGNYYHGTLLEYDLNSNSFSALVNFSDSYSGKYPKGDLIEAANGKLYGMTSEGGVNGKGVLFEYDIASSTYTKKTEFNSVNGSFPTGTLVEVCPSAISITLQPQISSVCAGDMAYISVAATNCSRLTYQWYKNGVKFIGETNDTITFNNLSTSDNGSYYCKIMGGAKAVVSSTYVLTVATPPVVNLSGLSNSYCVNGPVSSLTGTPSGGTFSGSNLIGSVFVPVAAGNFDIIYNYTDTQGCSNSDTASTIVNTLPLASFTGLASSYCINNLPATLYPTTAGGTFTGTAVIGNTFDPSIYTFNGGPLYYISKVKYQITDANGCSNSDSVNTNVYNVPAVTISGLATAYCANANNDTMVVSPIGGTITAGIGLSGNIFSPSLANLGNNPIYYSYTSSNNCTNIDTLEITVNAPPISTFTGLASSYCEGDLPTTLVPTVAGGTFVGDAIQGSTFNPAYYVFVGGVLSFQSQVNYTITDLNNCSSMDSAFTTIYKSPVALISGVDTSYCSNAIDVTVNTSPTGGTLSSTSGLNGNVFSPSLASLGANSLYYVFTDLHSCSAYDTLNINILESPTVVLGNDTTICINHTILLDAGSGNGLIYLWSDGSTNQTLSIDGSILGTGVYSYSVTVTNANLCEESKTLEITVDPCTGLEETDNDLALNVYPNPSNGIINITSKANLGIMDIEIYSSMGKLIMKTEWNSNDSQTQNINLSKEPKGVYYLRFSNKNQVFTKRIVIQ